MAKTFDPVPQRFHVPIAPATMAGVLCWALLGACTGDGNRSKAAQRPGQPQAQTRFEHQPAPAEPGQRLTDHSTPSLLDIESRLWLNQPHLREDAMEQMAAHHPDAALGAFELLITDGDHDIREAAIDIIADYRLTGAIPLLRAALNDPHPAVRGAAAQALENLAP